MLEKQKSWLEYFEAIVGVSVVLTLIVLIFEVRGNSLMIERQIRAEYNNSIVAPLISTPELLTAYEKVKTQDGWEPDIRAFMEQYKLEPAEAVSWTRMLSGIWWGMEIDYLTRGPSPELAKAVSGLLHFPDNQLYWQENRTGFEPGFTVYVDRQLNNLGVNVVAGQ